MGKWVTADRAAQRLGVSRPTVYKMAEDGRLTPLGMVNERIMVFDLDYLDRVKPTLRVAPQWRTARESASTASK